MTDALRARDAKDVEDAVRWALAEGKTLEVAGRGTKRTLGRPSQSDLTLDLSGLAITESGRFEFSSGLGDVDVKLPETGNVVIEWKTGLGDYTGPDGHQDGPAAKGTFQRIGDPSAATLTLVLTAGVGDLRVVT